MNISVKIFEKSFKFILTYVMECSNIKTDQGNLEPMKEDKRMNEGIFETVLKANKNYIDALNRNAGATEQENLLTQCKIILKTMVLDAGLANEYAEYCEKKLVTNGKLF